MEDYAVFAYIGVICLLAAIIGEAFKLAGGGSMPALRSPAVRSGVAIVGVISLVIAAVLYLGRNSGGNAGPGPATAPPTTLASAVHDGSTPPAAPPPSVPATNQTPASVVWQGTVRIDDGNGVDIGNLPVKVEDVPGSSSFWLYGGELQAGQEGQNIISEWTGNGTPSAADCASLLNTQPIEILGVHADLKFCTHGLMTRRLGFAQITSYDGNTAQVAITIWSDNLPR